MYNVYSTSMEWIVYLITVIYVEIMKLFNVHVILLCLGEGNIAGSNHGLFEQIM